MLRSLKKKIVKNTNLTDIIHWKNLDQIFYQKRKSITDKIYKIFSGKVCGGPYKDLKLTNKENWSIDLGSKVLGIYELEVQETIKRLCIKKNIKIFINYGSAEGFHLTGVLKKKFAKFGIGIEIDQKSISILKKNFKLNNISSQFKILEKLSLNKINEFVSIKDMKNTLFLIDIEGNEYELINSSNIKFIKKSHLIIEIHPFLSNSSKNKRFINLLKKNFKVQTFTSSSRNPHVKGLENLTDDERWMIVSEGRPMQMSWLVCGPK